MVPAQKHPNNPVLRHGPEGAPDHGHAESREGTPARRTGPPACGSVNSGPNHRSAASFTAGCGDPRSQFRGFTFRRSHCFA